MFGKYDYSRLGNLICEVFEDIIVLLEGGIKGFVFVLGIVVIFIVFFFFL